MNCEKIKKLFDKLTVVLLYSLLLYIFVSAALFRGDVNEKVFWIAFLFFGLRGAVSTDEILRGINESESRYNPPIRFGKKIKTTKEFLLFMSWAAIVCGILGILGVMPE